MPRASTSRLSPGYLSEIQASIADWLAEEYEVPHGLPESLATLIAQLAEPGGEDNSATA